MLDSVQDVAEWDTPFPRVVWFGAGRMQMAARISELLPSHGISNTDPIHPTLSVIETVLRVWDELRVPSEETPAAVVAPEIHKQLIQDTNEETITFDVEGVANVMELINCQGASEKICGMMGLEMGPPDSGLSCTGPDPDSIGYGVERDPDCYHRELRQALRAVKAGKGTHAERLLISALEGIERVIASPREEDIGEVVYVVAMNESGPRPLECRIPLSSVAFGCDEAVEIVKLLRASRDTAALEERMLAIRQRLLRDACPPE